MQLYFITHSKFLESGLKVTEQVQQEVIDTDNNEYTSNEGAQQVTEEVAEDM